MIRAIIVDCFGVLYVDSGKAFYEAYIPNYTQVHDEIKSLDSQHDYGLITKAEHNRQVAEISGLPVEFVNKHIEGKSRRNDTLLQFVQRLRPSYKVGMLSNVGPGAMDRFFSSQERSELFDAVVLSGDTGLTKPHPRIFELIAERLGVRPGECVMIDDLEANCAGADAAGMKAIRYQTNAQTIQALDDLFAYS